MYWRLHLRSMQVFGNEITKQKKRYDICLTIMLVLLQGQVSRYVYVLIWSKMCEVLYYLTRSTWNVKALVYHCILLL